MQRLAALLLTMTLGLGVLASCGAQQTGPSKATTPGASQEQVSPDVKAIQDRGVLRAGVKVDVPRFGYRDPQTGKIDGFEIDIVRAIARKILGDPNKVELHAVDAKTRGPALDNGEVDLVAATFTITVERKKSWNFSDSYYQDAVGLLVEKDSGLKSLQDFNGKTIGVVQDSTTAAAIQAAADKLGIKVSFAEFATNSEIKAALDAGRVAAFASDGAILQGYVDDKTVILPDRLSPQDYGVASKKGNDGLARLINDTISELKKSGELEALRKKWGLQ